MLPIQSHNANPGNLANGPTTIGRIFQISGTGIRAAHGYVSSQVLLLTEVQMHLGSAVLAIWLVIGAIAAGQRGDYTDHMNCSRAGTIGVTLLAGPLNYAGVNPHISCKTPQPSN